jgi:hypothetical protein
MTKLAPEGDAALATTQLVSPSHDMLLLLAALLSGVHGRKHYYSVFSSI